MASFNRVILMGNITRDIELKYTQSQLAVAELGVAVNDKRKNAKGEWVEETTFVDVTCWGRQAEIASEYLSKGSPVFLEGRLKLDTWEKDGQKRSKMRVICENLRLIGSRSGQGGGGGGGRGRSGPQFDESEYSGGSDTSDYDYGGGGRGGSSGGGGSGGGSADDIPF